MTVARRGEVWLVDLGMAAKVRPAVVVSVPADDTDRALVTIVPHTTSPRQSRFEANLVVDPNPTA
jgi:mRNA interferase MazF